MQIMKKINIVNVVKRAVDFIKMSSNNVFIWHIINSKFTN